MTFYATSMAATTLVQYRKSFDWTLTEGNPLLMLARGTENGQSFFPSDKARSSNNPNLPLHVRVIEMASEFPHVVFTGFDNGKPPAIPLQFHRVDLFPVPIATRYPPSNVQFEIHDVNTRFRWADNTFDVVHARAISMAVRRSSLTAVTLYSLKFPDFGLPRSSW